MLVTSVAKDWMLDGHLPERENLAFHAASAAVAIAAMLVRRPCLHEVIAPGVAALSVVYIAALFDRL